MIINKGVYPGGKKKCLIFSYDDDCCDNVHLADTFRRYGMHATFNFNGGWLKESPQQRGDGKETITKDEVKSIAQDFEIACHGFTHPPYGYMDPAQCAADLMNDRQALESITGTPVRGFAMPSGVYTEANLALLRSCGMVYCRTIDETDDFALPTDFIRWQPICKHDNFPRLFERGEAYLRGSWRLRTFMSCMLVYGHSYELQAPEKWQRFEEFLQLMAGKEDIWYASCIELYDYLHALDTLVMTVDGSCVINPSLTDITVLANNQPTVIHAGETRHFAVTE